MAKTPRKTRFHANSPPPKPFTGFRIKYVKKATAYVKTWWEQDRLGKYHLKQEWVPKEEYENGEAADRSGESHTS